MKVQIATALAVLLGLVGAPAAADEGHAQSQQSRTPSYRSGGDHHRDGQIGRRSINSIRQTADQLARQFDHLVEEVRIEARGRNVGQLLSQAREARRQVRHFQRALEAGISTRHLIQDFREMDRQVHDFLDRVARRSDNRVVLRQAAQVDAVDRQLHRAVFESLDVQQPRRHRDAIAVLAHSLDTSSERLDRLAGRVLGGRRSSLRRAIGQFHDEVAHFHQAYEQDASLEHVRQDFRELQSAWNRMVSRLNGATLPPQGVLLVNQAHRTGSAYRRLHRALNLRTQPQQITINVRSVEGDFAARPSRRDQRRPRFASPGFDTYEEYWEIGPREDRQRFGYRGDRRRARDDFYDRRDRRRRDYEDWWYEDYGRDRDQRRRNYDKWDRRGERRDTDFSIEREDGGFSIRGNINLGDLID